MSSRLARSVLLYWLVLGRLKASVLVVKFRILLRSLDLAELVEVLKLLEFCERDKTEFGILDCQEDLRRVELLVPVGQVKSITVFLQV